MCAWQVRRSAWQQFEAKLRGLLALERPWTLILEDPLANSFIAPATDDPANDHKVRAGKPGAHAAQAGPGRHRAALAPAMSNPGRALI